MREDTPLGGANSEWAGAGYGQSQPHRKWVIHLQVRGHSELGELLVEDGGGPSSSPQRGSGSRVKVLKNVMQPCDHTVLDCPVCSESELQGSSNGPIKDGCQ